MIRLNERTILSVDGQNLYHVHKDANLEGVDLYFGDLNSNSNGNSNQDLNGNSNINNNINTNNNNGVSTATSNNNNLLFIGGLPNSLQTYDLSLGTALFEQRFDGFIRNVRAFNCSYAYMSKLTVIASQSLRFLGSEGGGDPCLSSPCLNQGVCLVVSDDEISPNQQKDGFKCDCSFTNFEGNLCDKCEHFFVFFSHSLFDPILIIY